MERNPQPSRLRFVALFASLVVAFAMAAQGAADARAYANDIRLQVVNNSKTAVSVASCPNGHTSYDYRFGTRSDPCNVTPYVTTVDAGGGYRVYEANPIGIIIRAHGKTVYCYASNPAIGRPFIEVNGHKFAMVEGELATKPVFEGTIRLHRGGDIHGGLTGTSFKNMIIEVVRF